jgi:hypothetical protein
MRLNNAPKTQNLYAASVVASLSALNLLLLALPNFA